MPLYQVNAGDRILAVDINQFYNILKGVAASGEAVTLIYNAAATVIFQPSSDPVAGTEVIQIKNNGGTVQGSLTFDGKVKTADGTAALPSHRFQSEASGFYLVSAGKIGVSVSGAAANIQFASGQILLGSNPATSGTFNMPNNTSIYFKKAGGTDAEILSFTNGDQLKLYDLTQTASVLTKTVTADGTGHVGASQKVWVNA